MDHRKEKAFLERYKAKNFVDTVMSERAEDNAYCAFILESNAVDESFKSRAKRTTEEMIVCRHLAACIEIHQQPRTPNVFKIIWNAPDMRKLVRTPTSVLLDEPAMTGDRNYQFICDVADSKLRNLRTMFLKAARVELEK